ncbi:nitrite reductase small subunit NirD [Nibrella viscosa]|uniref:Nitrite reductase small subunit NirD n=1 Tax=Nibrella viscosa TaxID=1084524 RepID=A0ABP8KRU6_9BACT
MEAVAIKSTDKELTWHLACHVDDVPANGGACVLIEGRQIALFNFARRGEWYATDNECPHRQQMALARGMIGSQGDEPKVACPFHKKTFSLTDGRCLSDEGYQINTYPVEVRVGLVYIGLEG